MTHSRRDFLQTLSAPLMAMPFLAMSEKHQKYEGPILRVAIMGLGNYGTRVAEAMKSCKKAKLVGVISGTPSKIKSWQAKYQIPYRFQFVCLV